MPASIRMPRTGSAGWRSATTACDERDRTVIGYFRERDIPVCGVIGGGYSTDLAALAARHAILFEVAAEFAG